VTAPPRRRFRDWRGVAEEKIVARDLEEEGRLAREGARGAGGGAAQRRRSGDETPQLSPNRLPLCRGEWQ
jgi:hypothetical protein